jgi:pimeloyl-ACP methyl ester carboxylesterase
VTQRVNTVSLRTGITVRKEESGSGPAPPVLLLHAWAESLHVFDRLRPLLATTVHIVTFDQRGHGDSEKPEAGYDLPSMAEDAVALLEALALPPVVVVGTSSGGYVAQQIAVSHPDRVAGLVLVGAPASLQGRPPFIDEVARLSDPIDPAWVRESLAWFPRYHDIPGWYLDDRVRDGVSCPARAWLGTMLGLVEAVPPIERGTIEVPTTIVWGDRDSLLPAEDADRLHTAIPGSELVLLPDTGHLVLWEQPEPVASEVTAMIARLRGSS